MTDEDTASSGKFYDTKTGEIVTSPPEEGVQLLAPGAEETPAAKAVISQYEALVEDGDVEKAADTDKPAVGGDPAKTVTTQATGTTSKSSGGKG